MHNSTYILVSIYFATLLCTRCQWNHWQHRQGWKATHNPLSASHTLWLMGKENLLLLWLFSSPPLKKIHLCSIFHFISIFIWANVFANYFLCHLPDSLPEKEKQVCLETWKIEKNSSCWQKSPKEALLVEMRQCQSLDQEFPCF